jgi:hypothetical protein
MRKLNVYQCRYCHTQASESTMIQHEKSCFENPNVHACLTCFWMKGFFNKNRKCYLELLPISDKGETMRFRRRCKQWINKDHSSRLERVFKEKEKTLIDKRQ